MISKTQQKNLSTLTLTALILMAPLTVRGADIVISQGAGFNDNTPATPVGGNSGTTVGEQRLIAFEFAAALWSGILESDVQIVVGAQFVPQNCDANGGVLGSARSETIESDFANAPIPNTWYFSALANALANTDLNPGVADIAASFNASIDNNDNCLAGSNWYYGLDNSPPGTDLDFLNVVMHEIAHGLGSASVVQVPFGSLPSNRPDIYSRFAFDSTLQLHYDEMTTSQRATSLTNTGNVVWDGPAVSLAAPEILDAALVAEILNPALGADAIQAAAFGPPVPAAGLTGELVLVDDGTGTNSDGCESLTPANAALVAGNIALVDRGSCNFTVKTVNAEAAGAIAVVIANNVADGLPPLGGSDSSIGIPTVGITLADGDTIKGELPGVVFGLSFDPNQLSGANANGLVRLFAPSPAQPGSSFSHWDNVAVPNLLMEPGITSTLEASINVDLSAPLFADIGWSLIDQDGDLIPDINDNCVVAANTNQRDTNGDGFGNSWNTDLNGDGAVDFVDLGQMKAAFFGNPGPSSLPNACN